MQTAISFMWIRGPKQVFVLDFVTLLTLVVIMSLILENDMDGDGIR